MRGGSGEERPRLTFDAECVMSGEMIRLDGVRDDVFAL
jgi:hypothetical protein